VTLEERYPPQGDAVTQNGEGDRYSTELVVQVNFPAASQNG
jgi:hypothetical protein